MWTILYCTVLLVYCTVLLNFKQFFLSRLGQEQNYIFLKIRITECTEFTKARNQRKLWMKNIPQHLIPHPLLRQGRDSSLPWQSWKSNEREQTMTGIKQLPNTSNFYYIMKIFYRTNNGHATVIVLAIFPADISQQMQIQPLTETGHTANEAVKISRSHWQWLHNSKVIITTGCPFLLSFFLLDTRNYWFMWFLHERQNKIPIKREIKCKKKKSENVLTYLEHSEWCRCQGKSLRCCSSRDSLRSQFAGASFRLVFMLSLENWTGNCVADHFTTAVDLTTSRLGDTATCFSWTGTISALIDSWKQIRCVCNFCLSAFRTIRYNGTC